MIDEVSWTVGRKGPRMGASDNVTVVRRWANEGFAQGKVELVDELLAADFVNHSPVPGQGPDRDGVKAGLLALHAAFPDLSLSEDDVIAQGEKVVLRDTIRGTHLGPFAGIPPTGKQVGISRIASSGWSMDGSRSTGT
jgi:predicted ester cyclase